VNIANTPGRQVNAHRSYGPFAFHWQEYPATAATPPFVCSTLVFVVMVPFTDERVSLQVQLLKIVFDK
jgi:hypothetical protein